MSSDIQTASDTWPHPTGIVTSQAYSSPGPLTALPHDPAVLISHAIKVAFDFAFAISPLMAWDGVQRMLYDKFNAALQRQADQLLARGNITTAEARSLVEARNMLVAETRKRLTRFAEKYSTILKPALKNFDELLAEKGSMEAVLRSVGKTRQSVDHIGLVMRRAGPAGVVIDVTLTAFVIAGADERERGRIASREVGGLFGSAIGGWGGAWAGCVALSTLASPSLAIPIAGEVSTGSACLVGGLLGGTGAGWLGRSLGASAGDVGHGFLHEFHWKN